MSQSKKALIEKRIVTALIVIFVLSIGYSKMRIVAKSAGLLKEEGPVFNLEDALQKLKALKKGGAGVKEEQISNPLRKPAEVVLLENQEGLGEEAGGLESGKGDLALQGIIWNGKESLAIINGKVVGVGDMIRSAKVLAINEDGVVLLKDGSRVELKR